MKSGDEEDATADGEAVAAAVDLMPAHVVVVVVVDNVVVDMFTQKSLSLFESILLPKNPQPFQTRCFETMTVLSVRPFICSCVSRWDGGEGGQV